MMNIPPSTKERPIWVWIVSLFRIASSLIALWSYYLVLRGKMTMTNLERPFYENWTFFDYAIRIFISLIDLIGAVAFLLLRKAAFYLFTAALIVFVISTVREFIKGTFQSMHVTASIIALVIGYGITIAIWLYSWKLLRKGILT